MILFFLLPLILLTIAAVNFVQIRTPKRTSDLLESVGVIVPMRNEAENVEGLVATLAAQEGSFHFYLLDDNSEDQTFELLQRFTGADSRFTVIKGASLDTKWIGKTWALQQLFEASKEDVLVSIDADVRLSNNAINKAVTTMHGARLDFVSPYPRQLAKGFCRAIDSTSAAMVMADNCSTSLCRKFRTKINGCCQWTVLCCATFGADINRWLSNCETCCY
jgi:cellulose synthase/poly-beta-1,6-N-acetylglucosamine synthase-like glycosyltransferase